MFNEVKTRPSDGSEEEKEENSEEERKEERIAEERSLEEFVNEAEEAYEKRQEQQKEELERLKKRTGKKDEDKEETAGSGKNSSKNAAEKEKLINGQKIQPQKKFEREKGSGIFDPKGRLKHFGTTNVKRKMEKMIRRGAKRISTQKQKEFSEFLHTYHSFKRSNLSTLEDQEVKDLRAGFRRGAVNARFRKFIGKLREDGVIKNSEGVKKIFTKTEIEKLCKPLLGETDKNYRPREGRNEPVNRRTGDSGTRPTRK